MTDIVRETSTWGVAYVQHIVIMFYWVWIPGFLVAAMVSVRYGPCLREITLTRRRGAVAIGAAGHRELSAPCRPLAGLGTAAGRTGVGHRHAGMVVVPRMDGR